MLSGRLPNSLSVSLCLLVACSDDAEPPGETDGGTGGTSVAAGTVDASSVGTSATSDTTTTEESSESTAGSDETGEPLGDPACPPSQIGERCERQFILRGPMVAGDGNDLFVGNSESILRIDRTTGVGEVFSSAGDPSNLHAIVGEGGSMEYIQDLEVVPGGPLFVLQLSALHRVDRETGDRTWVPEPAFNSIHNTWDANASRLLVAEVDDSTDEASISVLDPATAERTPLASADDPGPVLAHPAAMAVDPASGTIGSRPNQKQPRPAHLAGAAQRTGGA